MALLAFSASGLILGQASAAQADDHHGHHGQDFPVVVSPAPGTLTKGHSEFWTYQYNPQGGSAGGPGSSDNSGSSGGSSAAPGAPAPQPGPVQSATETAKSTVASAAGGASSTVGAL
ncbi:hypothetical protein HG542_31525 [Streptomyces morookaense]|uniref:Uncharacterized protein n=1 Tax=Streptomyces morookaense TaxID=1970 RepID=A0A7Y7BAT0_STRMO|nr:hypothetical protein [Streptomyces morookaense]